MNSKPANQSPSKINTNNKSKNYVPARNRLHGSSKNNSFNIAHLNVRSLEKHIDEIKILIRKHDFDILCLTETWLHGLVSDSSITIEGYRHYRRDRIGKKGGGEIIYIKESIKSRKVDDLSNFPIESIWVEVMVKGIGWVLVSCMYREPKANIAYYESMLDNIESAISKNENIVILGDLNFDYKLDETLENNPVYYIEKLYLLQQLITEPTRVTVNTSTTLDVILTSIPELHSKQAVLPITLSDHYLVCTTLKAPTSRQTHNTIRFRDYKNFDKETFISDLEIELNAQNIMQLDNLSEAWLKFKNAFNNTSNKHVPIKTMRLKERNNPWFSREILSMMYKRDNLQTKASKTKSIPLWNEYKKLRNDITTKIESSKQDYFEDTFTKLKNDPRKLWKEIKKVFPDKKSSRSTITNISNDSFNTTFANMGNKVAEKFKNQPNDIKMKGIPSVYNFSMTKISNKSIEKNIKRLNSNSSLDILDMDSKLIQIASHVITPWLGKIFNLSIESSEIVDDFKLARVTPVYKGKGDHDDPNSYRPISVSCHFAKLLEYEVNDQLMKYLVSHDFISTDQSAYLKLHSTVTSLHRVVDDWLENIDDELFTAVCFLDIEKCFPSLNHAILLKKLDWYGVRNEENLWFQNYLSNRKQAVSLNNTLSKFETINIGVPQGSVLGPLLFLIYINDLPQNVGNGISNMFADDVLLYATGKTIEELNFKLQECVDYASEWYNQNKSSINADKCSVMTVSTIQRDTSGFCPPTLNGKQINIVDSYQYLGAHVDKHLKWNAQVGHICKTVAGKLYKLRKLSKFLNKDLLSKIFITCIQPHIEYALTVWGDCSHIDKIQRLQNQAARIICKNFDYVNFRGLRLVKQLGWMTCEERFKYLTCILMFKCIHGIAPSYLCNGVNLEHDVAVYNSRSKDSMNAHVPSWRTEYYKHSFNYKSTILWNSLPNEIKNATTLSLFKKKCKEFFNEKA